MKESILTIAQWNKETFPDATCYSQLVKFKKELQEWEQSQHITDHGLIVGDIDELADCMIVAASLARFNNLEAIFAIRRVENELNNSMYATKDLERAVDDKMATNRKRVWRKEKDGTYQHIIKENK